MPTEWDQRHRGDAVALKNLQSAIVFKVLYGILMGYQWDLPSGNLT